MPNRVSMTYFKTVQIFPSDLTVAQFNNEIRRAHMDDIVESMQMKHKLVSMRSKMTLIQRSAVIRKILEGL
jgi:recombinational DNA repair ATPase RecF